MAASLLGAGVLGHSFGPLGHGESWNEPFNKGTVLFVTKTKPRGKCFVVEAFSLGVLFGL